MGRPKSKEPTKNKSINFRVTDTELKSAQEICNRNNITYSEIFKKGLEHWSRK